MAIIKAKGAGNQTLVGTTATDWIYGGIADDKLYGGGWHDELYDRVLITVTFLKARIEHRADARRQKAHPA